MGMTAWYLAPVVFAVVAPLGVYMYRHRTVRRVEISDTNPDNLAERVAPFIGHPELAYHMNPEHLLATIGGRTGLRKMRAAIAAIRTISGRNVRAGTNEASMWEGVWKDSCWACLMGYVASLELLLRDYGAVLSIPVTGGLTRHYLDMLETMETIRTIHEYVL